MSNSDPQKAQNDAENHSLFSPSMCSALSEVPHPPAMAKPSRVRLRFGTDMAELDVCDGGEIQNAESNPIRPIYNHRAAFAGRNRNEIGMRDLVFLARRRNDCKWMVCRKDLTDGSLFHSGR